MKTSQVVYWRESRMAAEWVSETGC